MNRAPDRNPVTPWLEATYLTLFAILPITLSPASNLFFEGVKAFAARLFGCILLLLLGAWLAAEVRDSGGRAVRPRRSWTSVLLALGLLFVAAFSVATVHALHTPYAWFGCPGRGGGLLTLLAAASVMAAVMAAGRDPAAPRRLAEAMSLGTVAPVLLGALQMSGHDPLGINTGGAGDRVVGSFGNAIFLGSYLAVVLPLTLWLAFSARQRSPRLALLYGLLAAGQAVVLFGTGSRGPLLAAVGALFFMLLAWLVCTGRGRWARRLATVGTAAVVAGMLAFHVLFILPFQGQTLPPSLARLTRIPTVLVRLHIYRAISESMRDTTPRPNIVDAARPDPHASLRPWIGFGPQNIALATDRHFPPPLERLEHNETVIDAAHSFLLRTWVDAGRLGVAAWLAFFLAVLGAMLRSLGLLATRRERVMALATTGGLATGLAALLSMAWGPWAWALGTSTGITLGVLRILAAAPVAPAAAVPASAGLATAVGAAIMAFRLDAQASVATVSVTIALWALAGAAARCADAAERPRSEDAPSGDALLDVWVPTLLALLAAVNLHASMAVNPRLTASVWHVLLDGMTDGTGLMVLGLCLFGGLRANGGWRPWVVLAGGWLLAAFSWSIWLARVFGRPLTAVSEVLAFGNQLAASAATRYVWLACGVGVLGLLIAAGRGVSRRWAVPSVLLIASGTALLLAWPHSGRRAAMLDATARYLGDIGRPDLAVACLDQSLGDSAWDDRVHFQRHTFMAKMAAGVKGRPGRDSWMNLAVTALDAAQRASPYDARYVEYAGIFYTAWASEYPTGPIRQQLGGQAARLLCRAADLMPGRSSVGLKAVHSLMTFGDGTAEAVSLLRAIVRRDPLNARACELLAYFCAYQAAQATSPAVAADWRREAQAWAAAALESPWQAHYRIDAKRLRRVVAWRDQPSRVPPVVP